MAAYNLDRGQKRVKFPGFTGGTNCHGCHRNSRGSLRKIYRNSIKIDSARSAVADQSALQLNRRACHSSPGRVQDRNLAVLRPPFRAGATHVVSIGPIAAGGSGGPPGVLECRPQGRATGGNARCFLRKPSVHVASPRNTACFREAISATDLITRSYEFQTEC